MGGFHPTQLCLTPFKDIELRRSHALVIQGEDDLLERVRTLIPSQVYSRGYRPNLRKEHIFHYLLRVSRDSYGLPALSGVCRVVTVIPGPGKVPLRHIQADAAKKQRGGKRFW